MSIIHPTIIFFSILQFCALSSRWRPRQLRDCGSNVNLIFHFTHWLAFSTHIRWFPGTVSLCLKYFYNAHKPLYFKFHLQADYYHITCFETQNLEYHRVEFGLCSNSVVFLKVRQKYRRGYKVEHILFGRNKRFGVTQRRVGQRSNKNI